MLFKPSNIFLLIILAIFFGALSGILGVIIIGAGNFRLPFFGQINYASSGLGNQIVIEQPRSVIVNQDTQVQQVENDLLPAVISLYNSKNSADPLSAAYSDRDVLGRGFVLTADGWVVSTAGSLSNLKGSYSAVGYQNKKYALSGLISDSATGIVFAKMPAANLPVARLGKSSDLQLGQTIIIVSDRDQLIVSNISKIGYRFTQSKDLILSSDSFRKRIYFSQTLDNSYEGALAVNFKGEVIGIISGGSAVPVDYFSNIINDVLKSQKVLRAALGIDYIDLAQADGLINLSDKGAYVAYEPLKGTAAYGLVKKGDIIKKVNDNELNAFAGLADAVNAYRMNDKVDLVLSRGGKDMTVSVTLK